VNSVWSQLERNDEPHIVERLLARRWAGMARPAVVLKGDGAMLTVSDINALQEYVPLAMGLGLDSIHAALALPPREREVENEDQTGISNPGELPGSQTAAD
jgi:hypothetical protein